MDPDPDSQHCEEAVLHTVHSLFHNEPGNKQWTLLKIRVKSLPEPKNVFLIYNWKMYSSSVSEKCNPYL